VLFACVKTGTKYNGEYVRRLQRGVAKHLASRGAHEFVCFTDDPVPGVMCEKLPADLPGWWAKVGLFKLKEPMIYLDLDMVIVGNLQPLLDWEGFGIIKDAWLPGFNSSVMKLTGNETHVWDEFIPEDMVRFQLGDQQWITEQMPNARTFPTEWLPSYKAHKCFEGYPASAIAVNFHGEPKPSQIESGWVKDAWV
jgi:hypothetical protein